MSVITHTTGKGCIYDRDGVSVASCLNQWAAKQLTEAWNKEAVIEVLLSE